MTKNTRFDPDSIIIYFLFAALLVMSVVFFRERIIFTDTASYLDVIINNKSFFVPTNRYISVLTQILPLAGIFCGLSLQSLMILYSVNFILIPIILSITCIRVFKDKSSALTLLLLYIISNIWLFYYPVSEFQTGLALLLFYHAYCNYYLKQQAKNGISFVIISIILVTTIVFSHPLSILVLGAWVIWLLLFEKKSRSLIILIPIVIALCSYLIRDKFFKAMVGTYDYEMHRKEGLSNFSEPVITYFNNDLSRMAAKAWADHYFVTIAILIWTLGYLFYRRKWLQGLFISGSIFAFWLLVTVNFKSWPFNQYMEHMYQPVTFFIVISFGSCIFRMCPNAKIRAAVLCCLSGILMIKTINNNEYYNERLNWYQDKIETAQSYNATKAVMSLEEKSFLSYDDCWASSSETLLLSTLLDKEKPTVIIFKQTAFSVEEINADPRFYNTDYFNIYPEEKFTDLRKKDN